MDKINLEFVSLKLAEDGNGLIVRFRETEGRETEGVLRQTLIANATVRRVTVLERTMDQKDAFRFRPFETRSYRLTGAMPKIAYALGAPWTGLLTRASIPSRFERENNWIVPPANWKGDESNGNAWVRAPKDNPPPEFKPVTLERLGAAPAINQPYPAPTVSRPNLASW